MTALTWMVLLVNSALGAWQVIELRRTRQARRRFVDAVKVRGWAVLERDVEADRAVSHDA